MSIRTKGEGSQRLYDAHADINWQEFEILKLLFICGINPESIDTVTIDEIVAEIELVFAYDTRNFLDAKEAGDFNPFPKTASNNLLVKLQNQLWFCARRLWRARHLARFQASL